jgi:predicted RNA binding protein YcfA (HicA-like mRNA interferase family)
MTVRELIRTLRQAGWEQVDQKGSHRQFKKAGVNHRVTVPGNDSHEIPKGTLAAILKQAGLR